MKWDQNLGHQLDKKSSSWVRNSMIISMTISLKSDQNLDDHDLLTPSRVRLTPSRAPLTPSSGSLTPSRESLGPSRESLTPSAGWLAGRLGGWLAGRLGGCLGGWLAGRVAGWLAGWGWLAGRLGGWPAGRLASLPKVEPRSWGDHRISRRIPATC